MGACLSPVLANIIMTEFEKVVVDGLIQQGLIKFYARYVDDTIESIDKWKLQINNVRDNIKVIRRADHWQNLAF